MKWISHIAVAGAITAVIKPELVPIAILGSTAPDWLEWVLMFLGRRVRHRTVTHYVSSWVFGVIFGLLIYDYHHIILAFSMGGLSHLILDALTVSGVPFWWGSDRHFYLFGARFRTGGMGEYWFTGTIVIACICVGLLTRHYSNNYSPFFYDWAEYYNDGLIDASEWKQNRFKWL